MVWIPKRALQGWAAVFFCVLAASAQAQQPQAQPGRAFLGVELRKLTTGEATAAGLEASHGAAVRKVEPNSPAAEAGLKRGDIVLELDGKPVQSTAQVLKAVAGKAPGTAVTVRILREGRARTGRIKLGVKPAGPAVSSTPPVAEAPKEVAKPTQPKQEEAPKHAALAPQAPQPKQEEAPAAEADAEEEPGALMPLILKLDGDGKYAEAEVIAERYAALAAERYGQQSTQYAQAIGVQGKEYIRLGRYSEAETLLRSALALQERLLGRENPETLTLVDGLGECYHKLGRSGEAEPLLKRALEGRERVLGKDHPNTLLTAGHLGLLYRDLNRDNEAVPLIQRASAGVQHPQQR